MDKILKSDSGSSAIFLMALFSFIVIGLPLISSSPADAWDPAEQRALVYDAHRSFENFMKDPETKWFRNYVKEAQGLLIIPKYYKAGLVFAASWGRGVVMMKDRETGEWSEPAFYTVGSASVGLQVGGKISELIMMVMTRKGLDSLYKSSFTFGGEVSIATGPVGVGAERATDVNLSADYLAFARIRGAFAGASLEGAVMKTNDDWNSAYYGKPVMPIDILLNHEVSHSYSVDLIKAVKEATK
jgi:lipid-binding SYLF domain-containing protein